MNGETSQLSELLFAQNRTIMCCTHLMDSTKIWLKVSSVFLGLVGFSREFFRGDVIEVGFIVDFGVDFDPIASRSDSELRN